MIPAIQPKPVFTKDVARAVGTDTRMVRRVLSRRLVEGTKMCGRWILTVLQAVAIAIILSMRRTGFTWAEIPTTLATSIYHFPAGCPAEKERFVQKAEGADRLFRYLEVMFFDLRLMVKSTGDRRTRWVEFWQEAQAPEIDVTNPVTVIPVHLLYRDIRGGRPKTAPNRTPKGRLSPPSFSKKEWPVIAAPALTEQTSHQPKLQPGTLSVGHTSGKLENRSCANREPQPSTPKSRGNNPNEIKRQALVESLNRASQMASDPDVATDYPKLAELGSLLEDLVSTAMDVATDLLKTKNE